MNDLFENHREEMKQRTHRRFKKLYIKIADDRQAGKKLWKKKAPSQEMKYAVYEVVLVLFEASVGSFACTMVTASRVGCA